MEANSGPQEKFNCSGYLMKRWRLQLTGAGAGFGFQWKATMHKITVGAKANSGLQEK